MNYDFNFQQSRILREEVTLMPGDSLITECGYDSRGRNVPTFGGYATKDEMCQGFLYYYPRGYMDVCCSRPANEVLLSTLGIQDILYNDPQEQSKGDTDEYGINLKEETKLAEAMRSGEYHSQLRYSDHTQFLRYLIIQEPEAYRNQSLYELITSEKTWENVEFVRKLQDIVINGDHIPLCSLSQDAPPLKKSPSVMAYPTFTPLPATADKCNSNIPGSLGTLPEATDTNMTSGDDFGTTERNLNLGSNLGYAENESKAPGNSYEYAENESKAPGNVENESRATRNAENESRALKDAGNESRAPGNAENEFRIPK
ncbi:octopamine biosynthetic process [Halocaridina rubra]|uniref:Octopamine biosynthetic process n=1 Tax=Halocaridina rubra TaxID=373956 RepID=A0AAN9ACS4_HALRR